MATTVHTTRAIGLLIVSAFVFLSAVPLSAQEYSYLPTASTTDGRFLSLAGGTIPTLGENPMIFKLASPAGACSIEIGFFDGDTYGMFDQGTIPLIYTLYADPEGDGSGEVMVEEWRGDAMTNNVWHTVTVNNVEDARCGCGDYFYKLEVRSFDPATFHWSSFKIRTDGSIVVKRESNFTFSAPLGSLLDAAVVYPAYPALTPTTYDGDWRFYMDVPSSLSSLEIWDGDFDRGSYNCTDNDVDDDDTPNTLPVWATGAAKAEGVPVTTIPCTDAAGNVTGGNTTSNPPDDSRSAPFARPTGIGYEVIAPDGVHYANANPSGNLEWEQFRLSTAAFSRSAMDHHADALPAGTYEIAIDGLDFGNLNALRFPFDVTGVDTEGNAVMPIRPDYNDGEITGTVYWESGGNCTQGLLELGISLASVTLAVDYNNDGITDDTWCTLTDLTGGFCFSNLHPGAYTVKVNPATLLLGACELCDTDGVATAHTVKGSLTMCSRDMCVVFGYKKPLKGLLGALERGR